MPKNEISREIFEHLVKLAALELGEEEAQYLFIELNNQLSSIHELEAINIDENIPLASHGVPYTTDTSPPNRSDIWTACDEADAIIDQAPMTKERYIIVPNIPHTTLE